MPAIRHLLLVPVSETIIKPPCEVYGCMLCPLSAGAIGSLTIKGARLSCPTHCLLGRGDWKRGAKKRPNEAKRCRRTNQRLPLSNGALFDCVLAPNKRSHVMSPHHTQATRGLEAQPSK